MWVVRFWEAREWSETVEDRELHGILHVARRASQLAILFSPKFLTRACMCKVSSDAGRAHGTHRQSATSTDRRGKTTAAS